jgi:glucose-6-phosphate-specific signal transduction histidine kinase
MLRHPLDLRSNEPPWFRTRPGLTLVVAGVLFAAIFALRLGIPGPEPAVSLLFVLPVALLALARGLRAGLASGVIATVLLTGWSWANDVDLSLLAWATRVVPLVLTGLLLGDASDRLARSEARRVALELASERHSRAVEINDSLVQGMASAKWSLETGDVEAGIRTLRETIGVGQRLVSQLMWESSR